jgi:hypothetical protein
MKPGKISLTFRASILSLGVDNLILAGSVLAFEEAFDRPKRPRMANEFGYNSVTSHLDQERCLFTEEMSFHHGAG